MTRVKATKGFLKEKLIQFFNIGLSSAVSREDYLNGSFVAGGAITSLLQNESPNDIDIYFEDLDLAKAFVSNFLALVGSGTRYLSQYRGVTRTPVIESFHELSGTYSLQLEEQQGNPLFDPAMYRDSKSSDNFVIKSITSNAITLSLPVTTTKRLTFQVILRFIGDPDSVLNCFDFAHTRNFYQPGLNSLCVDPEAMLCLSTKELIYKGSFFPLTSFIRMRKFINRGWSISGGEILKILLNAVEFDFSHPQVLADQLQGVDVKDFKALVSELKAIQEGPVDKQWLLSRIESSLR
jgi:hypothetical protein